MTQVTLSAVDAANIKAALIAHAHAYQERAALALKHGATDDAAIASAANLLALSKRF